MLVYGNFSLVKLPTNGAWTVRFRYSPPSFQLGAFTSFIAAVVIVFRAADLAVAAFYARNVSTKRAGSPDGEEQPRADFPELVHPGN